MTCPKCGSDSKVTDKRSDPHNQYRRRRECLSCEYRFTTRESLITKEKKDRAVFLLPRGITLILNRKAHIGSIESKLKDKDYPEYNHAIDGLEALILAQACEGLDLRSKAYRKAVGTAVDAITNQLTR